MSRQLSQGKSQANVGILVVDHQRRIVSLNRNFIEMWKLPKHLIASQDEDQALEFVSEQFEDPKSFLKEVKELYMQPNIGIHDILRFKDGRVLARSSQPQWLDGNYVGRVWTCRELVKVRCWNDLSLISHKVSQFSSLCPLPELIQR